MNILSSENRLLNSVFKKFLFGTVIAILCTILGVIANGIIIGNFFGKLGLSAFALTTPVVYGFLAISYIFSYGGSIVCSNNFADKNRINNNFSVVCILAFLIGALLTISAMFPTQVALMLGASKESIASVSDYLSGYLLGIIPTMFVSILNNYSRIDGFPNLGLKTGLILFSSNVALDFVFLLVFKTNIYGVGLATALSNYIACIFLLRHFLSKKSSFRFKKNLEFKNEFKEIFRSGLAASLNQLYNMVRTMITNRLAMMVGGLIFLGAMSVQSNVYMLLCTLGVGIGTSTLALSGIFYGEKDKIQLEQLLRLSVLNALILISIISIILLIFAPYFVYAFGKNPEVYDTAIRGLRIFAFSLPFSALCYILMNFYNATKQQAIANYISFAHSFLFLSFFATVLAFAIGGDGIWISFVLCEIVTLLTLPLVIRIKTKKFPRKLEDYILMEDNIFPKKDTYFAYIESEEELLDIVENIGEKLINNDLDTKTLLKIRLVVEEMGKNIFEHAYGENQTKLLNLRIRYRNTDKIIIYFQDNGIPFDLKKGHENDGEFYGIDIIRGISDDVEYNYNVKLNNNKIIIPIDKR